MERKRNSRIEKLDLHLRNIARHLVKFDTLDETFHYLIKSFWDQFGCDYVSIMIKTKDVLEIKASKGTTERFERKFPMDARSCSGRFFFEPTCCHDLIGDESRCDFLKHLEDEGFSTWFTVPIMENGFTSKGVCVIGYRRVIPLLPSARELFEEFGKDIASAIEMAVSKENEKKKIKGMEWLKENAYLGSIDQLVGNMAERAGKGTGAESAYVYLYDEVQNCFVYQPPSYGPMVSPPKIQVEDNYRLFHYFPYVEKEGGRELTIPLTVNLKTIGVLHVVNKEQGPFTKEDLELLQFLSSHVSVLIENARLYKAEMEDKLRLEKLMVHHQELVKQTLVGEGFLEITESLSHMLGRTVILFDRFMRPISHALVGLDPDEFEQASERVRAEKWNIMNTNSRLHWIKDHQGNDFAVWKVIGGGDLLGYLGLKINQKELDMYVRMTLNHALNVYAIQFIKQKLVLDVKEQVKDGFIHQLFAEKIMNKEKVIEYANVFHLNLFEPNKVGVFLMEWNQRGAEGEDLLAIEAKKTWLWERIREELFKLDQDMLLTRKDGYYVLIVPEKKEKENHDYWAMIYNRMQKAISTERQDMNIFMGISAGTKTIDDYYTCYRQALHALKIVSHRFPNKGFLRFDSLGSYSVLYDLQDSVAAKMFVKNYLDPLVNYGNGKGKDLFDTLRVYLSMNGNLKDTAERLYIHRSSLKYRLEKIADLLQIDIDDAEERFNLMLACKLYDLQDWEE